MPGLEKFNIMISFCLLAFFYMLTCMFFVSACNYDYSVVGLWKLEVRGYHLFSYANQLPGKSILIVTVCRSFRLRCLVSHKIYDDITINFRSMASLSCKPVDIDIIKGKSRN